MDGDAKQESLVRLDESELLEICNKYFLVGADGLYYKVWRRGLKRDCVGKRAGNNHHSGYSFVKIHGSLYGEHRIVWLMHTGSPAPDEIDHENGNKSDNGFGNLRLADRGKNCANRRGWSKSGYKGVYPGRRGSGWNVTISVDNRTINVGTFSTVEDAAKAYDIAAIKYKGEFAKLNFDRSNYE